MALQCWVSVAGEAGQLKALEEAVALVYTLPLCVLVADYLYSEE